MFYVVINDKTAVFVTYDEELFAIEEPGPLVRITSQAYSKIPKMPGAMPGGPAIAYLEKTNDAVNIYTWDHRFARLEWKEISDMIREGKEKGVEQEDTRYHIRYFDKQP